MQMALGGDRKGGAGQRDPQHQLAQHEIAAGQGRVEQIASDDVGHRQRQHDGEGEQRRTKLDPGQGLFQPATGAQTPSPYFLPLR